MSLQFLHDVLDQAEFIRVSVPNQEVAIWYGGNVINLHNSDLEIQTAISVGKQIPEEVTPEDVNRVLAKRWNQSL